MHTHSKPASVSFKLDIRTHTRPHTHTVLQRRSAARRHAVESAQTLSSQEVSEHVSEGLSSNLSALLHPDLPLRLSGSSLTDLRPLGPSVGVTAASERPGQTLLSRNHVKPVP